VQVGVEPFVCSELPVNVKSAPAAPDVLHDPVKEPTDSVALALPISVFNATPLV
jgi:hypothetical protein